jgi:L-ascorbate metabolism protein UlaG (beta-lactamase superfamily)
MPAYNGVTRNEALHEMTPPHFDGRRYYNPGSPQARGFGDVLRWKLRTRPEPSPKFVDDVTPSTPPSQAEDDEIHVTLVNHSTVLIQIPGMNILTDPVWSERVSPVTFAGPRRRRAPGVRMEDLPRIDLVLLSHNHYDHLDLAALRQLKAGGVSQFIVPRGVAQLMKSKGLGPVCELDWGESESVGAARIHCVPAMHFSARGLFDRNRTLWCGYVIEQEKRVIYFAADTGFGADGAHFHAIRERFGAPLLALLPIGAYEPRWFMSPIHMGPEEAVRAHEILGAATSLAIHHGTFQLADEALDTPKRILRGCAPDSFLTLDNGESVILRMRPA